MCDKLALTESSSLLVRTLARRGISLAYENREANLLSDQLYTPVLGENCVAMPAEGEFDIATCSKPDSRRRMLC